MYVYTCTHVGFRSDFELNLNLKCVQEMRHCKMRPNEKMALILRNTAESEVPQVCIYMYVVHVLLCIYMSLVV